MDRQLTRQGLLISFEGIEKVGKSTQILLLSQWLHQQNIETVVLREPGGTVLGETLRQVVLHDVAIVSPWAELLVFAAARAELTETVIRPHLADGSVVIVDRFIDSSVAYQGYGGGLPIDDVKMINRLATEGLEPDLTFWLQGPGFDTGVRPDQIESRDASYFRRVSEGYRELAQCNPVRWRIIDATQPMEDVFETICQHIGPWINTLRGG
ncbi:MAG: dTMP kinase [Sulfobacillus benefaciens]|uniref:Thymidylate kinase n=1 Tax=Sulfobacillus benefaciens TaxID=453960 RepID=A0A2T2XGJ4_9FIRM|nr:MAG: dTMP kinase [Sulfobacillus benefaciens]